MQSKLLSNLGLARRAGKLAIGTEAVRDAVKSGRAEFVLIACDASDNTKKEILDSARFYKKEAVLTDFTMSELSSSLGKKGAVSSVAVTDINFKTLIKKSFPYPEV